MSINFSLVLCRVLKFMGIVVNGVCESPVWTFFGHLQLRWCFLNELCVHSVACLEMFVIKLHLGRYYLVKFHEIDLWQQLVKMVNIVPFKAISIPYSFFPIKSEWKFDLKLGFILNTAIAFIKSVKKIPNLVQKLNLTNFNKRFECSNHYSFKHFIIFKKKIASSYAKAFLFT